MIQTSSAPLLHEWSLREQTTCYSDAHYKDKSPDQLHKTSISGAVVHFGDFHVSVCRYHFRVIPQTVTPIKWITAGFAVDYTS
jgi:hypothetical protein